ncbi:MAG: phosphoglucosamine mutase [Balneolaceae bacterium]|nr:phosphoglucosamine mutase [Balneolaceae bacterium]
MISVSGIRGIFGTDLTPENIVRFTAAYGTWVDQGTVVVGRDTRVTGQICEDIVVSTLQSVGCDVVKVGIATTPTVAMSVLEHEAEGAIILSASHNPAEWNALKLLNRKSEFLDAEQGQQVINMSEKQEFNYQQYDAIGAVTEDKEALDKHIQRILDLPYIDADKIADAGLSVAMDPVNGTGGIALPPLLEALGVNRIYKINDAPTGIFAHNPEPLPEHMQEICALVREKSCDIGIVTDPDTDRLALVTDKGELFGEENTQAAAFDFILQKKPGPVATNLSSSQIADDIAKKYGQICHRSSVGEVNVVKKMQEVNAVIGGEGNGGVINPDLHYGRDALVGVAMVLQMLAERQITLSEYKASLPSYHISKKKLQLEGINGDKVLQKAKQRYAENDPITIDGVKIHFDEGWVHLRKSNTEPIIRVYSEAQTKEQADQLGERVKKEVLS